METPDFSPSFLDAFDSWSFPPAELLAYQRLISERKPYLICITPRSGSTYLGNLLRQTRSAGRPGEYLNPLGIGPWLAKRQAAGESVASLLHYLTWVIGHQSQEQGAAGVIVSYFHLQPLIETGLDRLLFGLFKRVRLHRRDIVQQAVSLYLATETGLWHRRRNVVESERLDPTLVSYDEEKIRDWLHHIWEQELGWDSYLRSRRQAAPIFFYEAIDRSPHRVVRRIMRFLDVEMARMPAPHRSKVKKIGDARNIAWTRQFISSEDNLEYLRRLGILPERYATLETC